MRPTLSILLSSATAVAAWAQSPIGTVRYFNPYTHPTSWAGWGSAVYQGGGASVVTIGGAVPVQMVDDFESMVFDSTNPSGGWWNACLKVSGNTLNYLRIGSDPAVRLRAKWVRKPADWSGDWRIKIGNGSVGMTPYLKPIANGWLEATIPASVFRKADPSLDLTRVWLITLYPDGNYSQRCTLAVSALEVMPSSTPNLLRGIVKVDQVGYRPSMTHKVALVSFEDGMLANAPTKFSVVNLDNQTVVYQGALKKATIQSDWAQHGDAVYQGDFGTLTTPGRYQVRSSGAASAEFRIGETVYNSLFCDALRFFYYSRCSSKIVEPFAEGFVRKAVHADNVRATYNYDPLKGHFDWSAKPTRDVHGCWMDAGDTHVQVPSTVTALWYLLETMRDFPAKVTPGSLNLPESDGVQNDLALVVQDGTDWLKRMQDADGAVHHYILSSSIDTPHQVSDISSFATSLACGALAKVYGQLRKPGLLTRAQLAWSWLQGHPDPVKPRAPMVSGQDPGYDDDAWSYGDQAAAMDRRFRAFAAIELYNATGNAVYHRAFMALYHANGDNPLDGAAFGRNMTGWASDQVIDYPNYLNFAFLDYVRSPRAVNNAVKSSLKSAFLHQAVLLRQYMNSSGYLVPMLYPGHLFWGSSGGVVAPAGMIFARAYEWTGDASYRDAAENSLHWILGRNTVNRVFVSGYGAYANGSDFYSQFWTNLRYQPPGYLGGNVNVEGALKPVEAYPWKRFANTQDADTTEPGVYWNAALAWLAGYFAS